jgi:hypothetical protein
MSPVRAFASPILLLAATTAPVAAQTAASPPPAPPACQTAEHRQFDYWVGYWDVYRTGTDTLVAHSLIERRYNGCAIRENWMPLRNQGGGSFSSYHPASHRWRQLWVDSSNGWVEFTGGIVDGAMQLTGPWAGSGPNGENGIVRMRYDRGEGGTVRQHGEVSLDNGRTWAPSFDFTYRPSASAPPASPGA